MEAQILMAAPAAPSRVVAPSLVGARMVTKLMAEPVGPLSIGTGASQQKAYIKGGLPVDEATRSSSA